MPVTRHDLRRMRKAAGLTQEELAGIVGISAPYVSHIEVGTRRITLELLNAWCAACDRSLSALGVGHAEAREAVDRLDEVDAGLIARLCRALPYLEPAHRVTLVGLLEIWERWLSTLSSSEDQGARQKANEAS